MRIPLCFYKMKIKKIVSNFAVAYIYFPLIYIYKYWDNIYFHNYVDNYGNRYLDIASYLSRIFNGFFLFSSILLLSLIALQLIKDNFLYKQRNFFLKSIIVYSLINLFIIIATGYGNILFIHFPEPNGIAFIFVLLLFSVITQGILYYLLDKGIITSKQTN